MCNIFEAMRTLTADVWTEGIEVEDGHSPLETLREFSATVYSIDWADLVGGPKVHVTHDDTSL